MAKRRRTSSWMVVPLGLMRPLSAEWTWAFRDSKDQESFWQTNETMLMTEHPWTIEFSYDQVAQQYTETFFEELARKPFDRQLLDAFAERVRDQGTVCDLGCGPGHVARYLKDRGVEVCGVDLSAAMVQCATRLNPDIPFHKGDMRALDFPPASFAGMAAFYGLIHLQRPEVPHALQELYRALAAHAPLLLAFHGGTGEVHTENWFGQGVSIDATLFTPEEMTGYLHQAEFQVEQVVERDPYTFEYQSRRVYILASKG